MSSAFGDFGPLTERRRAEKARQQRRRIMIAAGTVSIIIILIVMGAAAVTYSGKQEASSDHGAGSKKGGSSPAKGKSTGGSSSSPQTDLKAVSKAIKVMCAQTDYTDACEKSIGNATKDKSASSPKDIVRAAVEVIGDAIGQAFDRADLIMSNDPRVKAAVSDCKEIFENAKEDLNRTLKGVDDVAKQGYQLRIWLSAVIAHQETCIDGFPDDDFKTKVKESFKEGKEFTSNALALIEKGASLLSSIKTAERRLLAEDDSDAAAAATLRTGPELDEDGVPEWVPDRERRVLKGGGFKNTLTPNVIVAKDGSGKFKTINEALAAMPKTYDGRSVLFCIVLYCKGEPTAVQECCFDTWRFIVGRYVIYVKEGVYEEYVTITKNMVNVTVYGDGSKKSIVTGNKSFVDGTTTFKTATFSKAT
jgi:pectinesterase inhibitor-like protein